MVTRTSVKGIRESLKRRYGLDLQCYRPNGTRCVVVRDPKTGGLEQISDYLSPTELQAWNQGYTTYKEGWDTPETRAPQRVEGKIVWVAK